MSNCKNMVYTPKRGQRIVFDCYEDCTEEFGTYWADMCLSCYNKYKNILGNRVSESGSVAAACYVKGCQNREADYYVDFDMEEVDFEDEVLCDD